MNVTIRPAESLHEVMAALRAYWTVGHPAAHDEAFARHWFMTPWVDIMKFPDKISVIVAERDGVLVGCDGVIITPVQAWRVIWSVAPSMRGMGLGMKLAESMNALLAPPIHVFGISNAGRPIYEKLGFQLRVALRWRLGHEPHIAKMRPDPADDDWIGYRYDQHPSFRYERRGETIVRSDLNAWGRVLHVARLGPDWPEALRGEVYRYDLVQAWAYQSPGWGWEVPPTTVPTVFHPVEARGNTLLVAGLPAAPRAIHGSDGGQDRPACVAA